MEMKKFKRILQNQETAKNNLLYIDSKRLYPLCTFVNSKNQLEGAAEVKHQQSSILDSEFNNSSLLG